MQAIIKIAGVQPSALAVLHSVVKQPYMHTPEQETVPYAEIMSSEFEPESETYTVTLTFNLVISSGRTDVSDTFAPLSALVGLFKSIDPRLLPDAVAEPKSKFDEALVEKIASEILGGMSACDITDSKTGEIIIPARRKITRTLIKALTLRFMDLSLGGSGTGDRVIGILRRIQDEQKSTQLG